MDGIAARTKADILFKVWFKFREKEGFAGDISILVTSDFSHRFQVCLFFVMFIDLLVFIAMLEP
jgi:hypothetical protein